MQTKVDLIYRIGLKYLNEDLGHYLVNTLVKEYFKK
jgi:hypothetical protein